MAKRQAPNPPSRGTPTDLLGWLFVFAACLLAYLPTYGAGFIWNDPDYVTRPGLQSLRGLWRIWFEVGSTEQYYPLLHSFFWVQHRLWGDSPFGYHLVNVLLHATAACLLAQVMLRLLKEKSKGGQPDPAPSGQGALPRSQVFAWLSALLFALHPVYVESVAWVTEQKNTLSTVFYLAAALVYLKAGTDRRAVRYWLATGLFLCAILSKSVTASLPAALLVAIWWRRGSLKWREDVRPLLPWFVMGAGVGIFTAWVEHRFIGARGETFDLGFLERGLLAGRIIWFYLGKLAWPSELVFNYPRWEIDTGVAWQWIFPIAAVAALPALWAIRRHSRAPLAAYLYFTGTLFPTMGFFNVFGFTYSYVADHWQYLPSIGPIVFIAAIATRAITSRGSIARGPAIAAAAVLILLGTLTWRQTRGYRDIETFYRTILADNPTAWMPSANLGIVYLEERRFDEAVETLEESLRVNPENPQAMNTLGMVLVELGRDAEARARFEQAIERLPIFVEAHFNIGRLLARSGEIEAAEDHFREGLRLRPTFAQLRKDLANLLLNTDRVAESISEYSEVLRLNPDDADANFNLGNALLRDRRITEAIGPFQRAAALDPTDAEARAVLGDILLSSGRAAEALQHYEAALGLNPSLAPVRVQAGIALLQLGRGPQARANLQDAVRLDPGFATARLWLGNALAQSGNVAGAAAQWEAFVRIEPNSPEVYNNLGTAYREMGDTARAIAAYENALRLNPDYTLARENLARLQAGP
jgi:tetratricopeptide (TPR) repeat protein